MEIATGVMMESTPMGNMPQSYDGWVNVTEAAQITGYNRNYLGRLTREIWAQPENERLIRIRRRSNGYDLWLQDLIEYTKAGSHGPYTKRTAKSTP